MDTQILVPVALMLPLLGWVIGEKMSQLHRGMTKAEVVRVLGKPDGYKQVEGHEVYR